MSVISKNHDAWERQDDDIFEKLIDATKIGSDTSVRAGACVALGIVLAAKIIGQALRDIGGATLEIWESER